MGIKRFIAGALIAASLLGPGKALARHHLAEVQAQARQVSEVTFSQSAQEYVDVVTKFAGFNTANELLITLKMLALKSTQDPEFKKYCDKNFKCKRLGLTLKWRDSDLSQYANPEVFELLGKLREQGKFLPPEYLKVLVVEFGGNKLGRFERSVKGGLSVIKIVDVLMSETHIAETMPFFVDKEMATILGVPEGWVMVVIGHENTIKKIDAKGKIITEETSKWDILVMHF